MSVLAAPPATSALEKQLQGSGLRLRRWNRSELQAMLGAGLFGATRSPELINGQVVLSGESQPYAWTRRDYHCLSTAGILPPDLRTELLAGEIIEKVAAQGTPHFTGIRRTAIALQVAFGLGYEVRYQGPLALSNGTEPEPDVLVAPGTADDYNDHHPTSAETLLLVEISDTTLSYDRGFKADQYAAEGIIDYWIVNVNARTLEVRCQPTNGQYRSLATYGESEIITPLAAPTAFMRVVDLLPLAATGQE